MISQLIKEMGLDVAAVVNAGDRIMPGAEGRASNIFYVEKAKGSPFIPAQADFVERYGIESVVGFGGLLRDDLFAVILFSRVHIPPANAGRFRTLAVDLKVGLSRCLAIPT